MNDKLTYQDIVARNKAIDQTLMLTGFGGLLGLAALGQNVPGPTHNPKLSLLTGFGALTSGVVAAIAAKKANNIAPVTVSDAAAFSVVPVTHLATTLPGFAMTSAGATKALEALGKKGKIPLPHVAAGLGTTILGAGAMLASSRLNDAMTDMVNHKTANRLGVEIIR